MSALCQVLQTKKSLHYFFSVPEVPLKTTSYNAAVSIIVFLGLLEKDWLLTISRCRSKNIPKPNT